MIRRNHYIKDSNFLPTISLIICAYDEEKSIAAKLQNTIKLDYPLDKLQVILDDDGSSNKDT